MAAVFEEQGPAYISLDGAAAMPLPAWSNLERTWDPEWQALLPGTPGQDYDFPKLKLWAELGANLPVLPMDGAQAPMVFSEAEPLQLEPKGNTNKELLKRQLQKTQLCMFWKRNCCAKGTDCTFAHSLEELKQPPDLRRTSLCKQWLKNRCPYTATTCRYAHGEAYLRRTFEDGSRRRSKARKDSGSDGSTSTEEGLWKC
ncbi:unnamed protein product [Effrenium voratum]|uniref:C3H1-type domain-containing protein n=1 Tax=Effrenium voratum TaxID=2562239 RepID=A0AA36HR50_9DINO|nr:unnamed protein product [Effrenium voratum]